MERFREAQEAARMIADELDVDTVIQTGSSLREEDFTDRSDLDLLVLTSEEPEESWISGSRKGIHYTVLQESFESFEERLEEGRSFELVALKFGRVLKRTEKFREFDPSDYKPTQKTVETFLQSGFNNYRDMIESRGMAESFFDAAYHSVRGFLRSVLAQEDILVESDQKISEEIEELEPELSNIFQELRDKRQVDFEKMDFTTLEDFMENEYFGYVENVETAGKASCRRQGLVFPGLREMKKLLDQKDLKLSTGYRPDMQRKKATLIARQNDEPEVFVFNLETGELERQD